MIDANGELHETEQKKITIGEEDNRTVNGGKFCKLWIGSMENLGFTETTFLVRIARYVCCEDNTIRRDGEVMTIKEMADVTKLGYSRLVGVVNGLIEQKIMGKHDTSIVKYSGRRKYVYSVNPFVYCKLNAIDKNIVQYYS